MSLPLVLPNGTVAVYGRGAEASTPQTALPSGIVLEPMYKAGTVYHIWDGGQTFVYGGDVIYWKDGNELSRVVTSDNITYTIVPARLATIDNVVVAP